MASSSQTGATATTPLAQIKEKWFGQVFKDCKHPDEHKDLGRQLLILSSVPRDQVSMRKRGVVQSYPFPLDSEQKDIIKQFFGSDGTTTLPPSFEGCEEGKTFEEWVRTCWRAPQVRELLKVDYKRDSTPFYEAILGDDAEQIKALLNKGEDVTQPNYYGLIPIDLAICLEKEHAKEALLNPDNYLSPLEFENFVPPLGDDEAKVVATKLSNRAWCLYNSYQSEKNIGGALKCLLKALTQLASLELDSSCDPLLLERIHLRLGEIYGDRGQEGDFESAIKHCMEAWCCQREIICVRRAKVLLHLGDVCKRKGNVLKAGLSYRQAEELFCRHGYPIGKDYGFALDKLGNFFLSKGALKKAAEYLRASLDLKAILYSGPHPDIALTINSLGLLYVELEAYQEAVSLYQEAIAIEEKYRKNQRHESIGLKIGNMAYAYGKIYEETGEEEDFNLARETYFAAGKHFEDVTSEEAVQHHVNFGSFLKRSEMYSAAVDEFEKAIPVARSLENQTLLAFVHKEKGITYFELKALRKAKKSLEIALSATEKLDTPDNKILRLDVLNHLRSVHLCLDGKGKTKRRTKGLKSQTTKVQMRLERGLEKKEKQLALNWSELGPEQGESESGVSDRQKLVSQLDQIKQNIVSTRELGSRGPGPTY